MIMIVDVLSWLLALAGAVFVLIGTIGLLRMPDFPTRVHAASLADVFGTTLVLVAVALQYGFSMIALKLGFIIILLGWTAPVAAHAMFKAYRQSYPE